MLVIILGGMAWVAYQEMDEVVKMDKKEAVERLLRVIDDCDVRVLADGELLELDAYLHNLQVEIDAEMRNRSLGIWGEE